MRKFNRRRYIAPMLQFLTALKYYASGTFRINVGDMTSVSVSRALASLKKYVISGRVSLKVMILFKLKLNWDLLYSSNKISNQWRFTGEGYIDGQL